MSANVTTVAYLDPASPGTRVLLGLVLLVAALLLIGADWARHEAAVARCTQSGAAFDTALGRCEAAPALAIADRAP